MYIMSKDKAYKEEQRVQGKTVLAIDDEIESLHLINFSFSKAGYEVLTATGSSEGLHAFFDRQPDLVMLDIMMPGLDGFDVCQRIRELSDVPIIMLTALNQNEYIVRALKYGADDYVTKPFNFEVLQARVEALLRRMEKSVPAEKPILYRDDYLTVDLAHRRVFVQGERVKLSNTEYRLLAYLLQNADRLLTSQQILAQVWGEGYEGNQEYLHAYIWQLRKKLEKDPANPTYLLTEHGLGYRFEKKADEP